jgi:5-methylcytosine-specific restriction endonuclease McrA
VSKQDAFYHRAKHREWRRKVLAKAGGLCEICKRYGRHDKEGLPVAATTAHHIKHADKFPELRYVVGNGMALCDGCHNQQHPEKGGKR